MPDGKFQYVSISIHVLREEDDLIAAQTEVAKQISIHVLREEDDASALPA